MNPALLIILIRAMRENGGAAWPVSPFGLGFNRKPTKMDRFMDAMLKAWMWVAGVAVVFGLLWVLFMMGFGVYMIFS